MAFEVVYSVDGVKISRPAWTVPVGVDLPCPECECPIAALLPVVTDDRFLGWHTICGHSISAREYTLVIQSDRCTFVRNEETP